MPTLLYTSTWKTATTTLYKYKCLYNFSFPSVFLLVTSSLLSFCFQFGNDTILEPECRDFLDRLIYERETASPSTATQEKKTQRDLIVRLDVVGRCAYINYFTRCLGKNKSDKKKNEKPNNFTPIVFLQFFFFVSFTSSDLLFSASAAASSFNYLKAISTTTTKSLLWSGQACIFSPPSPWK